MNIFVCNLACADDPPEASDHPSYGDVRIWDGSKAYKSSAQYICSDGMSLIYLVCDGTSWNFWNGTQCESDEGTTVPAEGTTIPVEGTTIPEEETTIPSEGTTVEDQTTTTVEATTIEEEGTTIPAEGTTIPVEETTIPAEETTIEGEATTEAAVIETTVACTKYSNQIMTSGVKYQIFSPRYPFSYGKNRICNWIFRVIYLPTFFNGRWHEKGINLIFRLLGNKLKLLAINSTSSRKGLAANTTS